MSASLVFEPVRPTKYTVLGDKLKFIFREKYSLGDGINTLGSSSIPYLEGLKDMSDEQTAKDVQKLISAIEKWGEVNIWLQY